jgi:hypothetical protein
LSEVELVYEREGGTRQVSLEILSFDEIEFERMMSKY